MGWIQKILVAVCTSAIGSGITIYWKLNYWVAEMLEIATNDQNILAITLILTGMVGILTLTIQCYWSFLIERAAVLKMVKWRSPIYFGRTDSSVGPLHSGDKFGISTITQHAPTSEQKALIDEGQTRESFKVTEDDIFRLNIFKKMLRDDIDDILKVLDVKESVDMTTIYSSALPKITISFHIWSSSLYRVEIGNTIRGRMNLTGFPAGDTPKLLVDKGGVYKTVKLNRGGNDILTLEQVITPEFRERLIAHYLKKLVDIDLSHLFVSVDAFDAKNNKVIVEKRLPIPDQLSVILPKIDDWNWSKYNPTMGG